MTRKNLAFALILLGALLVLTTPAWAPPPCKELNKTSSCNQTCYFNGSGPCASVWLDSNCTVHHQCADGSQYAVHCECDAQPGGGCFLAGTRITLADGTTKPIEEIAVGDVVLAYDKATGEMKPDPVKRLHAPFTAESYLVVNDRLRITPTQPVFSGGRWLEMGQLAVGDTLTAADGSAVPIETLEVVEGPITVYNFDVNPYETFVADGFIVHRKQETQAP